MKCYAQKEISCCSLFPLPLGKSCVSSTGSYKNVSVSFGVVIYGWIMFAQQQISQHETDRPPLLSLCLLYFLFKTLWCRLPPYGVCCHFYGFFNFVLYEKSLYNDVAQIHQVMKIDVRKQHKVLTYVQLHIQLLKLYILKRIQYIVHLQGRWEVLGPTREETS